MRNNKKLNNFRGLYFSKGQNRSKSHFLKLRVSCYLDNCLFSLLDDTLYHCHHIFTTFCPFLFFLPSRLRITIYKPMTFPPPVFPASEFTGAFSVPFLTVIMFYGWNTLRSSSPTFPFYTWRVQSPERIYYLFKVTQPGSDPIIESFLTPSSQRYTQ